MKNKTGIPVRGADFFERDNLINAAWDYLERGLHILIAAPRRVGKTSLMFYLMDHPKEKYSFIYLITESVNNENEFFRRFINKLIKSDYIKRSRKVWTYLETKLPAIKKLGKDGIEFGTKEIHNYRELAVKILRSVNARMGKLVIMVDEFPETLENIIRDEGDSAGIHFLQSNRELRQDADINKNVQFIYTGSIGLESIVSRLNAVQTINDLSRLKVTPLDQKEAVQFIKLLLEDCSFSMSDVLIEHILSEVEWLIPFYIQLIVEELSNISRDENLTMVTQIVLDSAFTSLLDKRNAFEHWHTRLRASLKTDEYNFAKDLLNIISENGSIHINEILDIAVKYHLESIYKEMVNSLVYDGYINNQENDDYYRYNSPLLKMWWRQNVAR
jgi:hypothetical protein